MPGKATITQLRLSGSELDALIEELNRAATENSGPSKREMRRWSMTGDKAVLTIADLSWQPRLRRLALLVNRFRWEDRSAAEARGRPYERVRSLLIVGGVTHVASQGIDRRDREEVLSVLDVVWVPGEDAAGAVEITLAGDGAIRAEVECLDLILSDVTRPYLAPSRKAPEHPE